MWPPTIRKRATKSLDQNMHISRRTLSAKTTLEARFLYKKHFNFHSIASLNTISAKKDDIIWHLKGNLTTMAQKRILKGDSPFPDDCLYEWFVRMLANKVKISGENIMEQSKIIAERYENQKFPGPSRILTKVQDSSRRG